MCCSILIFLSNFSFLNYEHYKILHDHLLCSGLKIIYDDLLSCLIPYLLENSMQHLYQYMRH
jgi:hypothetical protein